MTICQTQPVLCSNGLDRAPLVVEARFPINTMQPALELIDIDKRFGTVHANRSVSLRINAASVHGVVGENGAGKSTLMSIVYGFYEADSGEIRIKGKPVRIRSSQDAISNGIGMVHQHFMLVETMTVIENVILGAEGGAILAKGEDKARVVLKELGERYGLTVDPDAVVGDLTVGLQQRVEIIKALYRGADILILDEPTAVLTPAEADQLFELTKALKAQGKTVILITHKLREIMHATDTVSVMRRGEMIATLETAKTTPAEIAEAMVGRRVLLKVEKKPPSLGRVLLDVQDLTVKDGFGVARVKGATFKIHAGEIVGIAAVSGNGQSEILEALSGMRKATGRLSVDGEEVDLTHPDPSRMRALKLFHVPEDRHRCGLVLPFDAAESGVLGHHYEGGGSRGFLVDHAAMAKDQAAKMEAYDVRPPLPDLRTSKFSGGNQQKIVLAREMERNPSVLLIGQPTRGVDIGAIEFIHKRIIAMRDAGKAILLVSVELEEIMSLSDRIIAICGGKITGERIPSQTNERELGLLMAGIESEAA
jgi:general nucleoside transport system ATP-binding protein